MDNNIKSELDENNNMIWTVYDEDGFIIIRTTDKKLAIGAYKNGRI